MTIDELIIEIVSRNLGHVEFNSFADGFKLSIALVIMFLMVWALIQLIVGIFDSVILYLEKRYTRKKYLKKHRFDRFRVEAILNDQFLIYEDLDECGDFPLYVLTNPYNAQDICDILNMDKIGKRYTPKAFKKLSDSLQAEDINNLKTTENGGEKE